MIDDNNSKGTKYFRSADNILGYELIRDLGDNKYKDLNTKQNIKISKEELKSFIKLNPDGILFFHIVEIEGGKDIIVSLHRRNDYENGNNIPYCVCRQMIFDSFTNITNDIPDVIYLGVSMSIDTVSEDIPYEAMFACNEIKHTQRIYIYMDDSINEILSLFNNRKHNDVLCNIHAKMSTSSKPSFLGVNETLSDLLEENQFIYDFRKGYGIDVIDFSLNIIEPNSNLHYSDREKLEDIYKHEILNETIIPYTKEIDLKKISRNYILLDYCNNIFIMVYDEGEKINRPYARLSDRRDAIAMVKHLRTN